MIYTNPASIKAYCLQFTLLESKALGAWFTYSLALALCTVLEPYLEPFLIVSNSFVGFYIEPYHELA